MKRADYEKLSRLAPTIPPGKGSTDYFSPWDQQVELIAAALGKPEEGRALIERIEDDYAAAAPSTRSSRARPPRSARTRSPTGSSTSIRTGCRPTS
jgi:ABC-type Fe3+-hydroxamate transport system substrate-binding protein